MLEVFQVLEVVLIPARGVHWIFRMRGPDTGFRAVNFTDGEGAESQNLLCALLVL